MSKFSEYNFGSVYRTVCDCLAEMRKCSETKNYSHLDGLIEEVQSMVNRMEAGLDAKKDVFYYKDEAKKLRLECKKLKKKVNKLDPENEE